jgi:hypothetical protein
MIIDYVELGLFSTLFIGTCIFYTRSITTLDNKKFHLMMLFLLQLSYVLSILGLLS